MTSSSDPCPTCASGALECHRLSRSAGAPADLEVLACRACGEYWVEGEGTRLTPATLRRLGLLH